MKRYQGREWYLIAGVHIRRISVQSEVLLVDWKHEEAINTIQHLTFDILPCFEELIWKKDRKKKTPESLSPAPPFPTPLKSWMSGICWICEIKNCWISMLNQKPINCASHSLSMSIVSFFNLRAPICVQKKQYARQNVSSWPQGLPPLTFIGVPKTSLTLWTSSGC